MSHADGSKNHAPLRWEDAAQWGGRTGWSCVRCQRFFGEGPDAERCARYCCHTDAPCQCGGRSTNKSYTCCEACRRKNDEQRWTGLPRVDWDGETPLNLRGDDRYFYSPEEIADYIADGAEDDPPRRLEDLRLLVCKIVKKRELELGDFLFDDCGEDFDPAAFGGDEIEKTVNDWIQALPPTWEPTNNAVSLASLTQHVAPCLEQA